MLKDGDLRVDKHLSRPVYRLPFIACRYQARCHPVGFAGAPAIHLRTAAIWVNPALAATPMRDARCMQPYP
jgi:hypothetical protein